MAFHYRTEDPAWSVHVCMVIPYVCQVNFSRYRMDIIVVKVQSTACKYLDGVGQRQSDGERKALRDGHNEHRDADDDELDVEVDVVRAPRLLLLNERLDRELHAEDDDGDERDGHAGVANLDGQVRQLRLQHRLVAAAIGGGGGHLLQGALWRPASATGRVADAPAAVRVAHSGLGVWKEDSNDG